LLPICRLDCYRPDISIYSWCGFQKPGYKTTTMNGWDFSILWAAGRAVLLGQDLYNVAHFFYPLPFAYILAGVATMPLPVAYWLWLAFNLGLLVYFFRRDFWQWLLFVPVLHLFSSGQVELVWWGMERGMGRHWRGALLGSLITLKPQTAVLLLPWHVVDWLRYDRPTLFRWIGLTSLIWGVPLLWRPGWILEWLAATPPYRLLSASNSPGIFSLIRLLPALWPVLAVAAVAIFLWGQWQSKEIARATALVSSPVGLFYSTMALLGCAPAWLLTPLSLLATGLSLLTRTFIPFLTLPLAVVGWQVWRKRHLSEIDKQS
jgi:hypothetical protein